MHLSKELDPDLGLSQYLLTLSKSSRLVRQCFLSLYLQQTLRANFVDLQFPFQVLVLHWPPSNSLDQSPLSKDCHHSHYILPTISIMYHEMATSQLLYPCCQPCVYILSFVNKYATFLIFT